MARLSRFVNRHDPVEKGMLIVAAGFRPQTVMLD
jgi:hypothetical protein